jgi:ribosomal protein S12 methylthiotransferase
LPRSYYLDPFGCVKNQVDAENIMAWLESAGWIRMDDAADADLIIVNSCGFIEAAKRESIDAVLEWRSLYPGKKILLSGCLAQRYSDDLKESLPEADGFFGTDCIEKITEAAASLVPDKSGGSDTGREQTGLLASSRPLLSLPGSAYVKISEGCNNGCSFCAIPLIRGPLHCRSVEDIVAECRGLVARGIRELCIIGQDIGSYNWQGKGLAQLLAAIAGIEGDFWVRLLYIHPDHFPAGILDIMEKDGRFLAYFDIPFQHASAGILKAMNRRGSAESYLALADTIRSRLPHAVIRTTFLVGFPGESGDDFESLARFQEKLRPDWLGCFCYSREDGTAAYSMKNRVAKKTALLRKQLIEERQTAVTCENMKRFEGQILDVLLEEKVEGGEGEESFWLGRLYCHAPEVDGLAVLAVEGETGSSGEKPGDVLACEVTAVRGFDLEARFCREHGLR